MFYLLARSIVNRYDRRGGFSAEIGGKIIFVTEQDSARVGARPGRGKPRSFAQDDNLEDDALR
jgi:hypothetical protein